MNNAAFRPLLVYGTVVGLYFILCWPLSLLSSHLERQLEWAGARTITFQI